MLDIGSEKWPVFLTASRASAKMANRALLLIQGFEFSEHLEDSNWTLLTSKELSPPPTATFAPLTNEAQPANDFAEMSLADINDFMRANSQRLEDMGFIVDLWLVIDDAGLAASAPTGVVCKQSFAGGDEDEVATWSYTDEFESLRVPLDQIWAVFSGLNSREMELFDYQDINSPAESDGTTKFAPGCYREVTDRNVLERKQLAWESWRAQGFVE
ncbi:hypothetical protein B0H11DRAFT_2108127 [Mycena galericulata]|nr:hypothetical protein B0H11DRAFT_2108127 [Mycena galericulata]